jgi:hypothetical protein
VCCRFSRSYGICSNNSDEDGNTDNNDDDDDDEYGNNGREYVYEIDLTDSDKKSLICTIIVAMTTIFCDISCYDNNIL